CTSCLHIFRQLAQKILVMHQHYCGLFVQPDEKSDYAICTNDLISVSIITEYAGVSYICDYLRKLLYQIMLYMHKIQILYFPSSVSEPKLIVREHN
ncbi:MAG: hypothetical protein ACI4HN_10480, partial [Ruminococcus sp.]